MTDGPFGPATDLLGEVRIQLLMLNEQIRNLVELEQRELPAPQVTVEPAPVVMNGSGAPLDLTPLADALARLNPEAHREELQGLRKEFGDLATAIRHIAGSSGGTVGIGASVVTAGGDFPIKNASGSALHVTVDSLPAGGASTDVTDRSARLLGHVTVDNASIPVTGAFFQATQPVSMATNTPDVTDRAARLLGHVTVDNFPATQPVSGSVSVSNFPATQPVSGTVSLSANTPDVTDRAARLLGHVTVDNASIPVTGTFFQATQPVSGTVTANIGTGNLAGITGTVTVDSELPAAAALADATANPTAPMVAAANELFNGTTFDRQRGNYVTTTGDTGAKTATFAGATQTNYNARGAIITVLLGAVSGTTPTLSLQLQWSPDGGTTWFTMGPGTANLTASSQSGVIIAYPTGLQQSVQNAGTAAGVATGATVTLAMNVPLTRFWRVSYIIGGTLPSFTINSVNVNYLV